VGHTETAADDQLFSAYRDRERGTGPDRVIKGRQVDQLRPDVHVHPGEAQAPRLPHSRYERLGGTVG
jgi:hypothetical protein